MKQDLNCTGAARLVVAEETESPCPVEDGLFGGSKCVCMKIDLIYRYKDIRIWWERPDNGSSQGYTLAV